MQNLSHLSIEMRSQELEELDLKRAVVGRFSQATRQLTWQPTTKPKEAADLAATPGKSPHSPRAVPAQSPMEIYIVPALY